MAERPSNEETSARIKFGGGVHSRASEDDIDPQECALGENFELDPQNQEFRNRKPFDKIGAVPNAGEVRGFATLQKSDGTISMLVQADSKVYEWDGASTFTEVGIVSANAKLRGRLEHNWQLEDKVLITDLNLSDEVHEWDGTTFQQTSFTTEQFDLPYDNKTGTFTIGETVTDQTSGAAATIDDLNGGLSPLKVSSVKGTFGDNNQIKGKDSGATADVNNPTPGDTNTGLDPTSFGTFRAKYCYISNERAVFANVHDNGTDTPHLIVGSKRGDYKQISVAKRPSSALNEQDPFFLIQPDYRRINGMVESFGRVVTSSEAGSLWSLTGSSAKDFAFEELFPRSGAQGDESLVWAGNDIFYGRQGRIESVRATEEFGNVEGNDLSIDIANQIDNFSNWTSVYNSRRDRVYFFPSNQSLVWVYFKSLESTRLSPWVKWTTKHSSAFTPTAALNCLDPSDGLEYVFWGDADGNVYRMEGSGENGDAGTNNISAFRLSKLISVPLDTKTYDVSGWIRWRRDDAHTLTLRMEYAGENVFNKSIDISLPAATGAIYYGGGHYYNNEEYYATQFEDRLTRRTFGISGQSNEFQVRLTVEGATDFEISEVGLRITAAV